MKEKLTEKLKKLDFIEGQNLFNMGDDVENPYIKITLYETKKLFPEVAYIYFRRFPQENRPPLAQAYIFDFSDQIELPEDFGETVKNIWLTGKIALIYAFTQAEVKIISGYEQPEYKNKYYHISIIDKIEFAKLAQNKMFSAKKLDNGSFWDENPYQEHFNFKNSPYEILLKNIKQMLEKITQKDEQLPPQDAKPFYQKLLLRSILVKYLEDRRDETGGVFREGYFCEISGADDTFISVLNKPGAILKLFKKLEDDFNGNIFALSETEKCILRDKDLSPFTDVFDGNVDEHHQIHIWKLYSFNYLPIELISNIYEKFMPKVTGVFYTPPFLVDFLIDQSMPLNDLINKEGDYKVIDPSCGSGVFLVAAFKRLVQAWKIKHNDPNPKIKELKEILLNCIYGIDIKKESIELAAFSLTIALCDQLSPKVIRDLQFDDLTKTNLLNQDFFSVILNKKNKYDKFLNSFDLVIGNPPFEADLQNDALKLENIISSQRGFNLPDKQIALLFLEQTIKLCKETGTGCLIQKGGPLLYNIQSEKFRNYLFQNFNFTLIYDFSSLKPTLFENANVEIAAIAYKNSPVLSKFIIHVVIPYLRVNKHRQYIELDRYDIHEVNRNNIQNYPDVWKTNLLGGGRLHKVAKNLVTLRSLKKFLENKKMEGWRYAEGFIALTPKLRKNYYKLLNKNDRSEKENLELSKLTEKYSAKYLTNKPTIPIDKTSNFSSNGIDNNSIEILNENLFYRKANNSKEIFSPPHILIRKIAPREGIPVDYSTDFLSFSSQIIGIHTQNNKELLKIKKWIKHHKFLVFYVFLKSSIGLTSRPGSFLLDDILSIPYPENPEDISFTLFEQILIDDVLDYQIEFRGKGEKAKVMKPATSNNLADFAEVFLKVLNSVYKDFQAAAPIETTSFICFPFYFGKKPDYDLDELASNEENLEGHLQGLINYHHSSSLRINRILRIYDKNIIYLIKPKQLRYWLRSIAIRDADETVADFIHQGF